MFTRKDEILKILSSDQASVLLDGDDYGLGQLEAAQASIKLQSQAIIKLCKLMLAKGVISESEVENFFDSYGSL